MAFRILASAVTSLLVTLFNLLVAGNALAEGRRRFALGPLGIALVTACGTLSVVIPNADWLLRFVAGIGALLAATGFAVDAWGELGPGAARSVLAVVCLALAPVLFWPAFWFGLGLRGSALETARLGLLLRAFDASALVFLFGAHLVIGRRTSGTQRTYARRAAVTLAGTALVGLLLALFAFLRTGIVIEPTLVGILVAEAFVLVNVVERRVVVRFILSRSITYAALILGVAVVAAGAFRTLGYPVNLTLGAVIVTVTLLAAVIFLGLGEVLSRGLERVLFPNQARLARELSAAHGEVAAVRARLERAERLAIAGELAAAVAHEIKNPLAAVRGYAELLAGLGAEVGGDAKARFEKAVRIIREESDRIDARVAALLRMGRPASQPDARGSSLDLARTALEAIAVVEGEPEAPEIRPELDAALGPARGEADAIRGALVNLLRNAVEAGAREPIVVRGFREGMRAVVEIRDRGPGIPPELAHRLFEPFQTTKPRGTGLGLCIARAAAEAAGGTVVLRSRDDGPGAVARLELPEAG